MVSRCDRSCSIVCRQFMGWKRSDPLLVGGANFLVENLPRWGGGTGKHEYYYWYYGTLVLFQMGGDWWKAWNGVLRDMLIRNQIKDMSFVGGILEMKTGVDVSRSAATTSGSTTGP